MSLPGTPLLYDASERKYYRLIPGPNGRGVREYIDDRHPSNIPPPRSSSRSNPLALPQNLNVPQSAGLGQFPRPVQSTNPQQVSRNPIAEQTTRGSANTIPLPHPTDQCVTQKPPVQRNQAVSQAGHIPSLASGVARLSFSDAQRNLAQQGSHQTPLTSQISGYRTVPVNPGPSQQNGYLYSNPYVDQPPPHAAQSQRLPFQHNYTAQNVRNYTATSTSYALPGYSPATGPVPNPNPPSFYPQPNPRPNAIQPSVSPGMTLPNQTPNFGSQAGQGPQRVGLYRNDLSNYEGESVDDDISAILVRGTEGSEERLDPSFRVVKDHWRFFVEGRVFIMLSWESVGHGNTAGNSIRKYPIRHEKHGEEAFAKVYRYIVVRPRPKQGYSMCLRISTHGGQGAVGKLINQKEHGIVYMGETPPKKLAEEKNLHKDPIQITPADKSQNLHPLSRIHYAKPYPVEHNVKVREVGMVSQRDRRKVMGYYQLESGYDTEREPERKPERRPDRRPRRESESSTNTAPDRRLHTEPEATANMDTERKPERRPERRPRRESESSTNTAPDRRLLTELEATANRNTERRPRRESGNDRRKRH